MDYAGGDGWKNYLSKPQVHPIEGGKLFSDRTYELMDRFSLPPPGPDHLYAFVDGKPQIRREKNSKAGKKFLEELDQKTQDGYEYKIVDEAPKKSLTSEELDQLADFSKNASNKELQEATVKVEESEIAQKLIQHKYFGEMELVYILTNVQRYGSMTPQRMLEKLEAFMPHVAPQVLQPLVSQMAFDGLDGAKFEGAEFTVRWLAEQDKSFLKGVTGFEIREGGRIYDLVYKGTIHYEFKNDKNPLGSKLMEQMRKDLQDAGSLEDFQLFKVYVLSEEKAGPGIKEKVLDRFIADPDNRKVLDKFIRKNKRFWDDLVVDSHLEGNEKYYELIKAHLEHTIIVF